MLTSAYYKFQPLTCGAHDLSLALSSPKAKAYDAAIQNGLLLRFSLASYFCS
jgi:hypothetical protein